MAQSTEFVRELHRFYMREIGADLRRELKLDAGYLSRIVAGFETRGYWTKKRSETDARVANFSLTKKVGRR